MLLTSCYLLQDRYKTQEMSDKVILQNGETLMLVPDYYRNQKICNKTVDDYPQTLEFIPDCFKTHPLSFFYAKILTW